MKDLMMNKNSCSECKWFGYNSPTHDQPYPEFWCAKNHWHGIEDETDSLTPIRCNDFEKDDK